MSFETLHYGESHSLQTVTVAKTPTPHKNSYWVILIHGGAWRDPTQTATGYLEPAAAILSTSLIYSRIAAFASVNYRLSPHPSYPQDPSTTRPAEYRCARHPDHIHDVQSALAFLQRKYRFGERYILVGHSCGATLAFQTVMGRFRISSALEYPLPTAILGMEGIYDLKLIRDMHQDISAYQQFIECAFGSDEGGWDSVSPAAVEGPEGISGGWDIGQLAVLAHSPEDSLVDPTQKDKMGAVLARWAKVPSTASRRVEILDVEGEHDEAWLKGGELARAITFTLHKLQELGL